MAKGDLNSAQSRATAEMAQNTSKVNQLYPITEAGYADFAKTGGITPEEKANARKETSYGIGSLYGALKQNLARRKNIQGGYAPGLGAQEAKLGRNAAEMTSEGINATNLGLLQQERAGKLAGLGGLSGLEGLYQGQMPQYLGIKAGAAANQKNWWQNVGDAARSASDVLALGSGF